MDQPVTQAIDIPFRELKGKKIAPDILRYIPEDSAKHYQFVPIGFKDSVLEVGIVDPDNVEARGAVSFIADKLGVPFKFYLISKADFEDVLMEYAGISSEVGAMLGELDSELSGEDKLSDELMKSAAKARNEPQVDLVEDAPITKIVAVLLRHATDGGASDIHIEPTDTKLRVRFRVDGVLYTSLFLPLSVLDAVVARIKIISNMKLDEKRKPQDGRFSAPIDGVRVDFRVSTFPTYFGEKVVIRILDTEKGVKKIEEIGFSKEHLEIVRRALAKPYGMVLLTGPTGSRKSTTLYSMLNELDREKYNILSLEDPIEYSIPGLSQSQVRPEIDYTFASGLRSILRQDPDIIMVGEIRDKETAQLAVQAALTGHLVFSTLHTNNAIGVVPRLIDMGVDPYLIAPTLILSIAQRLVRVLCPDSKEEVPIDQGLQSLIEKQFADLPPEFRKNVISPSVIYHPKSSPTCPGGTHGRMAVFEMYEVDRDLENLILKSPGENEVYTYVRSKGFITMKEDAMLKSFAGFIPFEEVGTL